LRIPQSLPNGLPNCNFHALKIGQFTGVVAEIELSKVAVQVTLCCVLIDALHAALKYTEVAFNGVCRHFASSVVTTPVTHKFMLGKLVA
jgi:hypothetical protein